MKRIIIVIILLLATMPTLTACNTDDQARSAEISQALEQQGKETAEGVVSTEKLLEDFDYMIQSMEDTFPYFGVAERHLGVDIRALSKEIRTKIEGYPETYQDIADELGIAMEDMPEMDEQIFWSILYIDFFGKFPLFAHSFAHNYFMYDVYKPSYTHAASYYSTSTNRYAFTNAGSKRFYDTQKALLDAKDDNLTAKQTFILRGNKMVTEMPYMTVRTEILEEGRVAYMKVPSFSRFSLNVVTDLRRFYSKIQDYDHLIIDIRNNAGGSVDLWRMYIMRPLWKDTEPFVDMPIYAFFKGTKQAKYFGDESLAIESRYARYFPESTKLLTTDEILKNNSLPHMNQSDLKDLTYGVKYGTDIGNIEWKHMNDQRMPNMEIYPFQGKIWLLTNGYNYSASSLFARHAKEMGFATLVGEPTGGAYATYPVNFTLPNTGIVVRWDVDYLTDAEGRALNEFPTTPHHENAPGLDALETVLKLISEK